MSRGEFRDSIRMHKEPDRFGKSTAFDRENHLHPLLLNTLKRIVKPLNSPGHPSDPSGDRYSRGCFHTPMDMKNGCAWLEPDPSLPDRLNCPSPRLDLERCTGDLTGRCREADSPVAKRKDASRSFVPGQSHVESFSIKGISTETFHHRRGKGMQRRKAPPLLACGSLHAPSGVFVTPLRIGALFPLGVNSFLDCGHAAP